MINDLPPGYSVCRDDDGDWILVPPGDVNIFSEPGEGLLLNADNGAQAMQAAIKHLREIFIGSIEDVIGYAERFAEVSKEQNNGNRIAVIRLAKAAIKAAAR